MTIFINLLNLITVMSPLIPCVTPSVVLTLLGRIAAHAWRTARRNSGVTHVSVPDPFFPKHAQWGSYLDSELANQWPLHPDVPEGQTCHVLCGAWHCPGQTRSFVQKRPSPKEAHYHGEAWCSVGSWWLHPAPPVHSSHRGGWHPIPWLRAHGYRPWVGYMCAFINLSPCRP